MSLVGRYNKLYEDQALKDEDMSKFRYSPEVAANISYDWSKVATFSVFYKFTGKRKEYMIRMTNSIYWAKAVSTGQTLRYLALSANY